MFLPVISVWRVLRRCKLGLKCAEPLITDVQSSIGVSLDGCSTCSADPLTLTKLDISVRVLDEQFHLVDKCRVYLVQRPKQQALLRSFCFLALLCSAFIVRFQKTLAQKKFYFRVDIVRFSFFLAKKFFYLQTHFPVT